MSFETDKYCIELNVWDTSGSPYYDDTQPLAYPDSDTVFLCFHISQPETLGRILKKRHEETQEFSPRPRLCWLAVN